MRENALIVNLGSEDDNQSIKLDTKRGCHISNVQKPEKNPDQLKAAIKIHSSHKSAKLRSISATYNCMGMAFASRRTHIDIELLDIILQHDGYDELESIDDLKEGDLVCYKKDEEVVHVGIIIGFRQNLRIDREVIVLSKWGDDGEYLHEINDVPGWYGQPTNFYSERKYV